MKIFKVFILIIILCVSENVYSQHIEFDGCYINGNIKSAMKQLQTLGHEKINKETVRGTYLNRKCSIFLNKGNTYKYILSMSIYFQRHNTWADLIADYNDIIDYYKKRYGEPKSITEKFNKPYTLGDGNEMTAIEEYQCDYRQSWQVDDMSIVVFLADRKSLAIIYMDEINFPMDIEMFNQKHQK